MTDAAERLVDRIAVSPTEAAAMLGVSRPTVYALLHAGRIPSVRVGTRRLIAVAALRRLVGEEPA